MLFLPAAFHDGELPLPQHLRFAPTITMENAFAKSTSEVLKHFAVVETQGLTTAQVAAAREKHGRNGRTLHASSADLN